VKNASLIKFTGRKLEQKRYHRFSGYPGGLYSKKLSDRMKSEPEKVIRDAVFNMVDSNRLRKDILRRLKVVASDKHDYPVQKEIV